MKTAPTRLAERAPAVAALLATAVFLTGCGGEQAGPEAEIRAWIAAMQDDVENERRRDILSRVADDYTDRRGNDKEAINNVLRAWFLRKDGITTLVSIDDIEVIADTAANVQLTVGMAGTGADMFGISADAYRFELELGDGDDGWELMSARWGELGTPLK
ncbi:MAG: hypothetical protein AAFX10_11500 [Pseudomonadota bacterium]